MTENAKYNDNDVSLEHKYIFSLYYGKRSNLLKIAFILLAIAIISGCLFIKFDSLINLNGEVKPFSEVRRVQHLEGGIVEKIHAKEGQIIDPGHAIIGLKPVYEGADLESIEVLIETLQIENRRLGYHLADSPKFVKSPYKKASLKNIQSKQKELFEISRRKIVNQTKDLNFEVLKTEARIKEIKSRLSNAHRSLVFIKEQVEINEDLLREKITSRLEILKLYRERSSLQSRIEEDQSILSARKIEVKQLQNRLKLIKVEFLSDCQRKFSENQQKINQLEQARQKAAYTLDRTEILSPVRGIIKKINVLSIDEVITAGQVVAEIVPIGDDLVLEAYLPVTERGYVAVNMPVLLRLIGNDAFKYSTIKGQITYVSADTVKYSGTSSYILRIALETHKFISANRVLNVMPGMVLSSAIKIGERRLWEYLIGGFLNERHKLFSER